MISDGSVGYRALSGLNVVALFEPLGLGFADEGNIVAWDQVIVGQSFMKGSPFESVMLKDGVDLILVGHVERQYDVGADPVGQRPHALFESFALKGEGELGPGGMRVPSDAPGNRSVVRHPDDQALLSCQHPARAFNRLFINLSHGFS